MYVLHVHITCMHSTCMINRMYVHVYIYVHVYLCGHILFKKKYYVLSHVYSVLHVHI